MRRDCRLLFLLFVRLLLLLSSQFVCLLVMQADSGSIPSCVCTCVCVSLFMCSPTLIHSDAFLCDFVWRMSAGKSSHLLLKVRALVAEEEGEKDIVPL